MKVLPAEPIDAWLSKWGSWGSGVLLLVMTGVALPSLVHSRAELMLGIGMACVACSMLTLFGVLSRRVHLAWHRGTVPWQARIGEFFGLVVGIGIGSYGFWCLISFELTPAGMIVGILLLVSLAFAIMCLGLWSTLSKTF